MAENTIKAPQQYEGSTSKSFRKMPTSEPEGHTVITIITDSPTTDEEEPTLIEQKIPETDELPEVYPPPPTIIASRTLSAQTPMSTSPICCSTAHSTRKIGRDPTATPTAPSDDTVETAE